MKGKRPQPQRTCVVCRAVAPKRGLMRLVRTPDGPVQLDAKGKMSGRGAYLCGRRECFTSPKAREAVARALKTQVGPSEWELLQADLVALADEREAGSPGAAMTSN